MHASDRYLAPGASLQDLASADGNVGYSQVLLHGVTGKGLNDYPAIFERLASINYSGWISIEDGMNGMDEMKESLLYLHAMTEKYFG
jgi:sugar phosphate isomerase/epimerase